jgi:catechol 2,3-dioxygenase-like lactoylglutathione lyase family enzyme
MYSPHHVQLAMPRGREAEARAFYADLLGLAEIDKPPALAARGGAWFRADTLELHLGVEDPSPPRARPTPASSSTTSTPWRTACARQAPPSPSTPTSRACAASTRPTPSATAWSS